MDNIIRVIRANIVTAFDKFTVGTKVTDAKAFGAFLKEAIPRHDAATDRMPGQHVIPLPRTAFDTVSCGVGRRTHSRSAYVLREYRGRVSAFLRRHLGGDVNSLAAIVYTREAYLADPGVADKPGLKPVEAAERQHERDRVESSDCTHVLVAVLTNAFGAPEHPPLSPLRFAANLAGGNNEALAWTADEIRAQAEKVAAYDRDWCVVAD
ncbi:hypothetical protein CMI47_20505 [Candidatus Pacearchaeota archaeon]|nr:hypothetical protein [Candidatus Pacearchaeota archaeon]|tara:strand:- start:3800 stop:4426 length:627 start_codon:yes stop_codon:yes gene_type:complete